MSVLVVDDDEGVRYTLAGILADEGLAVEQAADGEEALALLATTPVDLVVSDVRMPRLDGLGLLAAIRARWPGLKVILVTAHGDEREAVEAMKQGAHDWFRKPFDNDELLAVVRRALTAVRLERDVTRLASERDLAQSLVFRSPSMSRLAELVARVAPRDVTVLITGESGTGKERVAEAIVRQSPRAEKPYVRFNCAALTPDLAEAELFGHAKGAFTGAHRTRTGLFREAHAGTILLDEIGELDAGTQAKLLRVLQEREVRPVGDDRSHAVDVRILAATHRDLAQLVRAGRFREDLYYRLKVVELHVPPLRERPDDIALLARHFLARAAPRFGAGALHVPDELFARLSAYDFPGNVRELENVVESLVALSIDGALDLTLLPGPRPFTSAAEGSAPSIESRFSLRERVDAYEKGLIVAALETSRGSRRQAARALGLSRATLFDKMKKHGVRGGDGEPETGDE